jgi:hypothetical protein
MAAAMPVAANIKWRRDINDMVLLLKILLCRRGRLWQLRLVSMPVSYAGNVTRQTRIHHVAASWQSSKRNGRDRSRPLVFTGSA